MCLPSEDAAMRCASALSNQSRGLGEGLTDDRAALHRFTLVKNPSLLLRLLSESKPERLFDQAPPDICPHGFRKDIGQLGQGGNPDNSPEELKVLPNGGKVNGEPSVNRDPRYPFFYKVIVQRATVTQKANLKSSSRGSLKFAGEQRLEETPQVVPAFDRIGAGHTLGREGALAHLSACPALPVKHTHLRRAPG